MFKYVRYVPFTDEYTTHEFLEKNDKCKVHRFDVPYVSVEYDDEEDFTALMEYQNELIEAVEITKEEFYVVVQHSAQIKRMYAIANEKFAEEMKTISEKYTQEERDTWTIQVEEATTVKSGAGIDTPFITSLALDEGITLEQAADKVLTNRTNFILYSKTCLERKWQKLAELKAEVGL